MRGPVRWGAQEPFGAVLPFSQGSHYIQGLLNAETLLVRIHSKREDVRSLRITFFQGIFLIYNDLYKFIVHKLIIPIYLFWKNLSGLIL